MIDISKDNRTVAEMLEPFDWESKAWQDFTRSEREYNERHTTNEDNTQEKQEG